MKNITYYIGAGASADAIHPVEKFTQSLHRAGQILHQYSFAEHIEKYKDILIKKTQWLIDADARHHSIDTFAKGLWLKGSTGKNGLTELKITLSCLLMLLQADKFDKRYDTFFASFLTKKDGRITLPPNIKVISWNYDYQFEKSFYNYIDTAYIDLEVPVEIRNRLQCFPNIEKYEKTYNLNEFAIVKLNGVAGMHYNRDGGRETYDILYDNRKLDQISVEYIIQIFQSYMGGGYTPMINFAWEKDENPVSQEAVNRAKKIARDTDVLVIIGYSFPFYNREIDLEIFSEMKEHIKIYIQDINTESAIENFNYVKDAIEESSVSGIGSYSNSNIVTKEIHLKRLNEIDTETLTPFYIPKEYEPVNV